MLLVRIITLKNAVIANLVGWAPFCLPVSTAQKIGSLSSQVGELVFLYHLLYGGGDEEIWCQQEEGIGSKVKK